MLGALPVIIDLGGTKPLGGICIYLGGISNTPGNHETDEQAKKSPFLLIYKELMKLFDIVSILK